MRTFRPMLVTGLACAAVLASLMVPLASACPERPLECPLGPKLPGSSNNGFAMAIGGAYVTVAAGSDAREQDAHGHAQVAAGSSGFLWFTFEDDSGSDTTGEATIRVAVAEVEAWSWANGTNQTSTFDFTAEKTLEFPFDVSAAADGGDRTFRVGIVVGEEGRSHNMTIAVGSTASDASSSSSSTGGGRGDSGDSGIPAPRFALVAVALLGAAALALRRRP